MSTVEKADVINSEYFKGLDDDKKELMRLYLLCENEIEEMSEMDKELSFSCSASMGELNNFSAFIYTYRLKLIIEKLETTQKARIIKNNVINELNKKKALFEHIKNGK